MAAAPGGFCQRPPHARRGGQLVGRLVAAEDLADLEQRHVGDAAIGIALGGGNQPRDQARPHVRQVGRDRVGERKLRLAAAEQLRLRLGDEGPGDGFDQAAGRQRPLDLAGAQLEMRQHRLARGLPAVEGRRRDAVDPDDAHDLLDDIGLAVHVRAPRWRRDLYALALPGDEEAKPPQHAPKLRQGDLDPGQPGHGIEREIDHQVGGARLGCDLVRGRRSAAEIEHHLGRELEPRQHESRVDAALEAIARI